MTLDEAIKHAEEVADKKEREKQKWERWLENDSDYRAVNEKVSCELCAEEHRQLAEWLKDYKRLRERTKWVPVSEGLPKKSMACIDCLVTDEYGEYGVGYYREDAHAWDSPNWGWLERKDRVDNKEAFTESGGIGKVVAWMPLPEPYKP